MFRRIPNFVLWILLAVGVATLPLACSSDDTKDDAGAKLDTMTSSS
jgi:hypothetical protein